MKPPVCMILRFVFNAVFLDDSWRNERFLLTNFFFCIAVNGTLPLSKFLAHSDTQQMNPLSILSLSMCRRALSLEALCSSRRKGAYFFSVFDMLSA